jgi:hypothetical protein
MRVMDEATGKLVGHISDISSGGFKLDSKQPVTVGNVFRLRIDQTNEISDKSYLVFSASATWCLADPFDPGTYNIGFKITEMSPGDFNIFLKMFNTYGK